MQNRIDWPQQLVRGMLRASNSEDASSAYDEVASMLSTLGDPYTRIIPPMYVANLTFLLKFNCASALHTVF